jgi:cyclic beta-1,2-glucan synthetase
LPPGETPTGGSIAEGTIAAPSQVEEPIRAELFGAERLEQHAESLAAADRITEKPTEGRNLRRRVRENLGRHLKTGQR